MNFKDGFVSKEREKKHGKFLIVLNFYHLNLIESVNMKSKIFLLFLMLSLFVPQTNAETIRLATGEWEPFQGKKLKHEGPATRIVVNAFKQVGIEVNLKYYPWTRAKPM